MAKKKSIFTQEVIVGIVLVVLLLLFRAISADFGKYTTILSMLDISYYYVLMAIGVAFPLITGGVDLSIGTGMICYALAGGCLIRFYNAPTGVAILVSILVVYLYDYPRTWLGCHRFLRNPMADGQAGQRLVPFDFQNCDGE